MPDPLLYFDHNATTPVAPEVLNAYAAALRDLPGNPSSSHRAGQNARRHLEAARSRVAAALHAKPSEIVFTSGGTESNNLALLGIVRANSSSSRHVVSTAIEHPAVLEPVRCLERAGVAITVVDPLPDGSVDPAAIARALRDDTVLVSLMQANNETGVLQPLAEVAALVRERRGHGQLIYLHSDGVQAFGKIPVDVARLGLDLYSVSAHKLHAPKGIGALFVRQGVPLQAMQFGGRHERQRRAGTENVAGAVAFARAIDLLASRPNLASLRDHFEQQLFTVLDHIERNGDSANRLPNTSSLLFHGVSAESLLIALDMQGMAVSTGSACSSGSIEPSPVLLAMGRTRDQARSSLRFSFGRDNTYEDIDRLAQAVIQSVRRMRSRQPREAQLAV